MTTRRFPVDWSLVGIALVLSIYGIAIVYSAGQTDVLTRCGQAMASQLIWFCLAIAASFGMSRVSVRLLDWLTWPLYGATIALLALLLVFIGKGFGTGASSKSWLAIGGFRLGQPVRAREDHRRAHAREGARPRQGAAALAARTLAARARGRAFRGC